MRCVGVLSRSQYAHVRAAYRINVYEAELLKLNRTYTGALAMNGQGPMFRWRLVTTIGSRRVRSGLVQEARAYAITQRYPIVCAARHRGQLTPSAILALATSPNAAQTALVTMRLDGWTPMASQIEGAVQFLAPLMAEGVVTRQPWMRDGDYDLARAYDRDLKFGNLQVGGL